MAENSSTSYGLTPNTTGNGIVPEVEQIIVVDFRQWYQHGFEYVINGHVIPIWTILNICIYFLMVYVFLKNGMTTKSHICLIAISVTDSLSAVCPSIMWFYFFAVRKQFYYLPYAWCRTYHYMTEVIPHIFSGTSLYITILLSIQRYIAVGHPFKVDRLCTKRIIIIGIFVCVLIAFALKAIFVVHYDYFGITVPAFTGNGTLQACAVRAPKWLNMPFYEYLAVIQAVFTFIYHLMPCTALMIFEFLLIFAVVKSAETSKKMASSSRAQTIRRRKERQLTYATLAISSLYLLYGLCASFTQILDFLYLQLGISVISNNDIRSIVAAFNFLYFIMLPSNFVITCCLSEAFRKHLSSVLKPISKRFKPFSPLTMPFSVSASLSTNNTSFIASNENLKTPVDLTKVKSLQI